MNDSDKIEIFVRKRRVPTSGFDSRGNQRGEAILTVARCYAYSQTKKESRKCLLQKSLTARIASVLKRNKPVSSNHVGVTRPNQF